ncbi:MAG: hypothetical protein GF346_10390 [Candidatus Eisenbacteria bacterium]|nr:hypothetical protein [Candidatus Latescibacterota bacterium]MBD3302844.1 hypothetical protein [Candidatus Eisenbacteria bacterium]
MRTNGSGENPRSDHPEIEERLAELGLLDDPEFVADALRAFLSDGEETIARLQTAVLETHSPPTCEQAGHRLKGASLNIGAERLGTLARQLEELGRAGDLSRAPSILADLETEFASVRAAVRRLIERANAA